MTDKIGEILVAKGIITESHLMEALDRKDKQPGRYLGQILCEMGLPQSKVAKAIYYSNKRKQLGQVLVDLKIITPDELHYVLLQQTNLKHKRFYRPLGKLLAQKGIIGEEQYMEALSAHFCMPVVTLKDFRASPSLQKLIGERYAAENRIVVLDDSPRELTVAIADPHLQIFETLEKSMPEGKEVRFSIARASEIEAGLAEAYEAPDQSGSKGTS